MRVRRQLLAKSSKLVLFAVVLAAAACRGGQISGGGTGGDAGLAGGDVGQATGGLAEAGLATAMLAYPALAGSANGVLGAPKFFVVDLGNSARATLVGQFLTAWSSSAAWSAVLQGYGVGPGALLNAKATATPWQAGTSYGDVASSPNVLAALAEVLQDAAGLTLDGNLLAVLVVPPNVAVQFDPNGAKDSCADGVIAWHDYAKLPTSGAGVPYVVVANCATASSLTADDLTTVALSHAVLGATTNPMGQGFRATAAHDPAAASAGTDVEVATLCAELLAESASVVARPSGLGFAVHRGWSATQTGAAASPCVPAVDGEVVLQVQPQGLTPVAWAASGNDTTTVDGITLAAGATAQVPLKVFVGDGKLDGVQLRVVELNSHELGLGVQVDAQSQAAATLSVRLPAQPQASRYLVRLTASRGASASSRSLLVAVGGSPAAAEN